MRKFSQRTLRDFGFGKRYSMQSVIEVEISDIMAAIRREMKDSDGIIKIRTTFLLSVLNVLWCMIAGHRYSHDDPKLKSMLNKNFAMTKAQTFVDPLVLLSPWLREIFPKLLKWSLVSKVYEESHEFSKVWQNYMIMIHKRIHRFSRFLVSVNFMCVQSLIEERKQIGTYLSDPQNYIDCFLKKIHEFESQNKPSAIENNNRESKLKSPVYSSKRQFFYSRANANALQEQLVQAYNVVNFSQKSTNHDRGLYANWFYNYQWDIKLRVIVLDSSPGGSETLSEGNWFSCSAWDDSNVGWYRKVHIIFSIEHINIQTVNN